MGWDERDDGLCNGRGYLLFCCGIWWICLSLGMFLGCIYEEEGGVCRRHLTRVHIEWSNHVGLYAILEAFFPCSP